VPSWENRDLRQLLWHRHRMVQARTRIMNQLQAVARNEGLRCKKRLWRERGRQQLESFRLALWVSRRRRDLLELLDRLNPPIAELSQAIEQEVETCPEAQRLMTHPGVGPLTALAFVLIIGEAKRFQCGKQVASYLGLVPLEDSSGNRRRLGHITKQGSSMLRFLLVEAAQVTAGACHNGVANIFTGCCAAAGKPLRSQWRADSPFVCTGGCASNGTTRSGSSSVRTRDSSDIAMVCHRTPRN
jgi:transposase